MTSPDGSHEISRSGVPVFGDSAYRALQGAFRLAGGSPDASAGTHHVLLSLALRTHHVRRVIGSTLPRLRALVAEGVEDAVGSLAVDSLDGSASVTGEVDATLREAQWQIVGFDRHRAHRPRWTPALRDALTRTLLDARRRSVDLASSMDVIPGILSEPDSGASRLLGRLGIRRDALLNVPQRGGADDDGDYRMPIADTLRQYGVASSEGRPTAVSLPVRIIRGIATRVAEAGPVLIELELEAIRQAMRLGHSQVDPGHLLVAILELDHQLGCAGLSFSGTNVKNNCGGMLLRQGGVTLNGVLDRMSMPQDRSAAAEPHRRRRVRTKRGNPEWTVAAARAADACRHLARQLGDEPGSLHLLLSALQSPSPSSDAVIRWSGAEPAVLVEEAKRVLR